MEQQQLDKFKRWFSDYVSGFYGKDEYVNINLKLKEDHTERTCIEMLYLASQLGLGEQQRRTAETIALFHDIGRFEQFSRCQTYNDQRSLDHAALGVEILHKNRILDELNDKERKIIETAIAEHGSMELPSGLDGELLLFARLIRDADKLDIFHVVTEYCRQEVETSEKPGFELEFPDVGEYSQEVVNSILNGQRIHYVKLHTMNDMRLLQLAWVYDVNFVAALERIRERRFLEKILDLMPRTKDIERVRNHIFLYIDRRIAESRKSGL